MLGEIRGRGKLWGAGWSISGVPSLVPTTPHTITALGDLRQTLLALGKKGEALDTARLELEAIRDYPPKEWMEGLTTVAQTFEQSGAFAEALALLESGIKAQDDGMGVLSAGLVSLMALASLCYVQVGDLQSARGMMARFLLGIQGGASSEDCEPLVDCLVRLANFWLERGCAEERAQVLGGLAVMNTVVSREEGPRLPLHGVP